MSCYLLDVNLLIALAWPQHVHHVPAHKWFDRVGSKAWATSPLTQLGFVRISSNAKIISSAVSPREAATLLRKIAARPGHEFWTDELQPIASTAFASPALVGHRQVTDAYLLALAQHHGGVLATLDRGIADLIQDGAQRGAFVECIAV